MLLDILKFIFSKESREATKDVFSLLRSSKEWTKDIIVQIGKFKNNNREESKVLLNKAIEVLSQKNWGNDELKDVRFIYTELLNNAFEHGIGANEHGLVEVKLVLSSPFVRLIISNTGKKFNLDEELVRQAYAVKQDREHGLLMINKLVTELTQEDNGQFQSIIALKFKGIKPLRVFMEDGIKIFRFSGEINIDSNNWSNFLSKIKVINKGERIIIDFFDENARASSRSVATMSARLKELEDEMEAKIIISGIDNLNYALQDFFMERHPTFSTIEEAKRHFYNPGQQSSKFL